MGVAERRNLHEGGVEILRRHTGSRNHACLIGIDGIDTVVQNLSDYFVVCYTETNEGKDTELCVQKFVFLERHSLFRP